MADVFVKEKEDCMAGELDSEPLACGSPTKDVQNNAHATRCVKKSKNIHSSLQVLPNKLI